MTSLAVQPPRGGRTRLPFAKDCELLMKFFYTRVTFGSGERHASVEEFH